MNKKVKSQVDVLNQNLAFSFSFFSFFLQGAEELP